MFRAHTLGSALDYYFSTTIPSVQKRLNQYFMPKLIHKRDESISQLWLLQDASLLLVSNI